MNIYIYDGPYEKGEKGYPLIRRAIGMYCLEKNMNFEPADLEIGVGEKGKPYLISGEKMGGIEFSLTHSGDLWMCLVSNTPCGLDVQIERETDMEGITKRYFSPSEQHYVELWGATGFYSIWVRREAFGKLTGEGFFGKAPEMVSLESDLLDEVSFEGRTYYFTNIEIGCDISCAVCATQKEKVEIRAL